MISVFLVCSENKNMGVPLMSIGSVLPDARTIYSIKKAFQFIMKYISMYAILCCVDTLTAEMHPTTPTYLWTLIWGLVYAGIAMAVHETYDYLIIISVGHELTAYAVTKFVGRVIMRNIIQCVIIVQMAHWTAWIRPIGLTWWQLPWIALASGTGFTFIMTYEHLVEWLVEHGACD
jgi:hypothetical protein